MKNILTEFNKFINKDVLNESESKDLAVLVRFNSLSTFIFLIIASIYFAINGSYFLAIISVPFLGLYVVSFIESYENKTIFAVNLFTYTSVFMGAFYTLLAGWDKNFQWIICITALTIFFSTDSELTLKKQKIEIIMIVLIAISVLSHIFGP